MLWLVLLFWFDRVTAMAAGSYGRRALAHMRPTPYLASHWRFYIVIPALLTALLASCATLSPDSSLRGVEDLTKERTRQPFAMTTGARVQVGHGRNVSPT